MNVDTHSDDNGDAAVRTAAEAQMALAAAGDKIVVFYFTGRFCGPCKQIKPVVAALAQTYARQLRVFTIDIGARDLVANFAVRSIPTFVLLRRNKIIYTHTGADAEKLTQLVQLVANAAFPELIHDGES